LPLCSDIVSPIVRHVKNSTQPLVVEVVEAKVVVEPLEVVVEPLEVVVEPLEEVEVEVGSEEVEVVEEEVVGIGWQSPPQ